MRFVWDPKKAKTNLKKHGVSFEEAETVLHHADTLIMFDSENSTDKEDRFKSIGLSIKLNILVVIHCEREGDENRIISARKALPKEVQQWRKK